MLIDRDVQGAEEYVHCDIHHDTPPDNLYSYVKQTIADLLQNKIDMSQLVITKALAKAGA